MLTCTLGPLTTTATLTLLVLVLVTSTLASLRTALRGSLAALKMPISW